VVALAVVLQLLLTSALTQVLLAWLGRRVKREWTRALGGLAVGVAFVAPVMIFAPGLTDGQSLPDALAAGTASFLAPAAKFFTWFPTTAFAVRAAGAAFDAAWPTAALHLGAGVALLAALGELGTGVALREALNREAPAPLSATRRQRPSRWGAGPWSGLLSGQTLALVARDLRYVSRTPQVLLGMLVSPLFVVLLPRDQPLALEVRPFFITFLCLAAALNVTSNQFGLDRAGVRLLLLLPVTERRLLVGKNITCVLLVGAAAAIVLPLGALMKPGLDLLGLVTTLASLATALPVILVIGNQLSLRQPWRMSFRMGGTPPGAVISACAQLAAVAIVALLIVPPLVILPLALGFKPAVRLASLGIIASTALGLWAVWRGMLPGAARRLARHRERLIDRLASAHETA
jgi:hypothetical protein